MNDNEMNLYRDLKQPIQRAEYKLVKGERAHHHFRDKTTKEEVN